jgi:hypothetical protein
MPGVSLLALGTHLSYLPCEHLMLKRKPPRPYRWPFLRRLCTCLVKVYCVGLLAIVIIIVFLGFWGFVGLVEMLLSLLPALLARIAVAIGCVSVVTSVSEAI